MVFFLYKISVINFASSVDSSSGLWGIRQSTILVMGFASSSDGKASVCNAGDLSSIPGSGRFTGEGNSKPLQLSCLENPWTVDPGRLQSTGSQRVAHDRATNTH